MMDPSISQSQCCGPVLSISWSRGGSHWVTNRARRLTKAEMMCLQGMAPKHFKVDVSECQLGKQIGNAMSANVLERLFIKLLPAAGLVRHGVLRDRWQFGKPPATLVAGLKQQTPGPLKVCWQGSSKRSVWAASLKRQAAAGATSARKRVRL